MSSGIIPVKYQWCLNHTFSNRRCPQTKAVRMCRRRCAALSVPSHDNDSFLHTYLILASMSNDYLSTLPEEMLEEISNFFDVYYDYNEPHETYRALAQTCKSLRAHFQRRLFSYLYLPVDTRIRTFAKLIRDNPNLASYIRTIRLEVDDMCMGHFQYLPLLAIIHAASSSGTPPEILLSMGFFSNFFDSDDLGFNLPSNTITHTLDAPQIILHAITNLHVRDVEQAIPVGLFRLLPNLRVLCGSRFALPSDDSLEEDHTTQFFRPKLNVLMLISCNPATIKMLCEQILDLSALKEFVVSHVHRGTTNPNAKRLLAWRILDHAQSVQKLQLDIGGIHVSHSYDHYHIYITLV